MQQPDSYGWSGGQSAGFPPLQSPMYSSVPVLGRTRCYWTILSASLDFVYLDPILEVHLGDQVGAFMGTNMLNYVHPDEIESLSKDLMPIEGVLSGVEAAGVMGSVTRCRYSRVPRIRKQLGCESPPQGYDSHMFSWMGDFLDLKITTSWIAGSGERKTGAGAVLAFFHGIEDKDSELNNNEADTSAGWSNYCGPRLEDGVYLSKPQCEQLGRVLATLSSSERINYNNPMSSTFSSFYQPPAEYTSTGPPAVVFQILDHLGNILLSFPSPDRASTSASSSNWYNVEEYAKLARAVLARPKEKSESTTSCTRRYRSRHPIFDPRTGSLSTVDSVVILYGAVTFVVFETGGVYLSTQVTRSAYSIEDVPVGAGELVRRESVEAINKYAPSPRHYTPTVESDRGYGGNLSPTIASASAILGSFSNSFTNRQEHSFDLNSSARAANLSRSQSPNFNFRPGAQQLQYSNSASGLQYSNSNSMAPPLSNPIRSSLNQSYSGHPLSHSSNYSPYPLHNPARPPPLQPDQRLPPPQDEIITPIRASSPKTGSRGKALKGKKIAAPTGRKCLHCEKVDSPEWRKGPGGGKTLCNACGLRYSRSLAKMNKNSKAILEAEKASGSNGSDREDQLASPSPTNSPRQLPLPEETTFELPALQGRGPPPIERRQSPLSSNLLYAPHQPVIAHEPVTLRPSPLSMPFSETHLARMSAAESNTPSRNALPFRGNINAYSRPPPRNAQPIAMFSNDRIGMQPDYSASPHSINWPSRNRNELSNSNSFRESTAPIDGSSLQQSQTFQEQQQHYQQQYQQQQQQRRQETLVQQQSNEPLPFAPHHFAPQQSQSSNYSPSTNLPPFDPYSNENGRSGFFQQIDSNNSNSMSANDSNGSSLLQS